MNLPRPDGRNEKLDALRGVCALIVVVYHATMMLPGVNVALWAMVWPRPFITGQCAVFVFFVLSGYVLQIAFAERGNGDVASFLMRRFARIYPPVLAVVTIALALVVVLRPGNTVPLSDWARQFWTHPMSSGDVLAHFLLLDGRLDLVPPLWSIVVEVRYSLAFPLIAWAVTRWGWTSAALAFWIGLCVDIAYPEASILRFLVLFAGGAALAHDRRRGTALLARLGMDGRVLLLCCAIALLCQSHLALHGVPASLGAMLLVACVAFGGAEIGWASRPLLLWLGRISYSLYLVHIPVMLALLYALAPVLPLPAILPLAIPASLLAAQGFWWAVERPAIAFGRRVGGMKPRAAASLA